MADKDEHRSVFAYVFGSAVGAVALALTAWIALRGRQNGGLGMPGRRHPGPDQAAGQDRAADEDLV